MGSFIYSANVWDTHKLELKISSVVLLKLDAVSESLRYLSSISRLFFSKWQGLHNICKRSSSFVLLFASYIRRSTWKVLISMILLQEHILSHFSNNVYRSDLIQICRWICWFIFFSLNLHIKASNNWFWKIIYMLSHSILISIYIILCWSFTSISKKISLFSCAKWIRVIKDIYFFQCCHWNKII